MPIQPNQFEDLARNVSALYEYLELAILEKITKRVQSGISAADWQVRKLNDIQNLQRELSRLINSTDKNVQNRIYDIIEQVFDASQQIANQEYLEKLAIQQAQGQAVATTIGTAGVTASAATIGAAATLGISAATSNFGQTRRVAVEAYARNLTDTMRAANESIFRTSVDAYRKIISESAITGVGGVENRIQATQRALNKFADEGISSFTDKAGRRWGIQEYAEMATRTAIMRTSIDATTSRLQQLGDDLVIISDHPKECPLCRPWERKVLSISGTSTKYPPLARARAAGLFHPNCGHIMTIYVDGLTTIKKPESDEKGYELKQQQRYIERQIRKWKRREAAAITDEDKKQAQQKVQQWQGTMRAFIKTTGLDRLPERERILTGKPAVQKVNLGEIIKKGTPKKENPKPKKKSLKDQVEELKGAGIQTEEQARKVGRVIRETVWDKLEPLKEKQTTAQKFLSDSRGEYIELEKKYTKLAKNRAKNGAEMDEVFKRQVALYNERQKARQEIEMMGEEIGKSFFEALKNVRDFGVSTPEKFASGSNKEMGQAINQIQKYLPADWLARSRGFGALLAKKVKRGYYAHQPNQSYPSHIAVSGQGVAAQSVAIHEMGHRFEKVVPLILALEKQFYDRRTEGEPLKWLGGNYRKDEKSRFDDFTNPYMGKDYKENAYELLSTGLEAIFFGKHNGLNDTDFLDFILGLLGAV